MPEANVAVTLIKPVVTYVLTVTVIDSVSELPITGATVKADATALTELGGGVYESTLLEGSYVVTANKSGYSQGEATVELDEDKSITIPLVEAPPPPPPIPWLQILLVGSGAGILLYAIYRAAKK